MPISTMIYRLATTHDCDTIAKIHTTNWKKHYRGICPDHYLDYRVEQDRLNVWRNRFASNNPKQHVVVAEDKGRVIGFVCSFLDAHPEYGTYLDNLHVLPGYQGQGIGKALMNQAGAYVQLHRPDTSLYLHVLTRNTAAIRFYERIGGRRLPEYEVDMPWGGKGTVIDFIWPVAELANL